MVLDKALMTGEGFTAKLELTGTLSEYPAVSFAQELQLHIV